MTMIRSTAAPTPRRKRRLPTPEEAFAGVPLAIANAERHLATADLLAERGEHGQAVAHLVLSLEESDKSRVLGMLWLDEGDLTEEEARKRLFDHATRNEAAFAKSWTIGVVWTASAVAWSDQVAGRTRTTDAKIWEDAIAQHPEALPADWPETAGRMREAGLYVDLQDDGTWHTPADISVGDYQRLRPAAVGMINYVKGAFERHKAERAQSISQV